MIAWERINVASIKGSHVSKPQNFFGSFSKHLSKGDLIDYLDFQKFFDEVPHQRFLRKPQKTEMN